MDQPRLTGALGLPDGTPIVFVGLTMVAWGRDLHFACEATPKDATTPFVLQLADCREMRWQIYTHLQTDEAIAFPRTRLASLKIGRDQHRSPLHLLTDHFGLSLMYGQLHLQVDDRTIAVP